MGFVLTTWVEMGLPSELWSVTVTDCDGATSSLETVPVPLGISENRVSVDGVAGSGE